VGVLSDTSDQKRIEQAIGILSGRQPLG